MHPLYGRYKVYNYYSMTQLTIKLSAKADALIAQLQKQIFNRRRKKITAAGVVESLVESGAKSQSDKRYASSWNNLIKDIEKAAKVSEAHGNKPANISADEWAMVLSHRTRKGVKDTSAKKTTKTKAKPKATSSSKTQRSTSTNKKTPKKGTIPGLEKSAKSARPARRAQKSTKVDSTALS